MPVLETASVAATVESAAVATEKVAEASAAVGSSISAKLGTLAKNVANGIEAAKVEKTAERIVAARVVSDVANAIDSDVGHIVDLAESAVGVATSETILEVVKEIENVVVDEASKADEDISKIAKVGKNIKDAISSINSKYSQLIEKANNGEKGEASEKKNTDAEASEKKDVAEKTRMEPPVTIEFTCKDKYDKTEYNRQVKNQEKGMNNISLHNYLKNRESYKENGRNLELGQPAQEKARQEARADRILENRRNGVSREEAEKEADEWLDTQAALHDPDQIAGGDAANVIGIGDKEINSSIGSQWQYRIEAVDEAVQKYIEDNNLSGEDLKNVYLNVNLEVFSE